MAGSTLNVIAICGSLRKGSYNAALARTLPSLVPAGMTITPAPAWDKMPVYNFDIQNSTGIPAEVNVWADAVRDADGVVIVSPEYNWGIPGGLKNAVDWASRLKDVPFKDKPIALQSCSGGLLGGARMQYALRMTLTALDAFLVGKPEVFVNFSAKKFDEKTLELTDQPTIDLVKRQLASLANLIARVGGKS